MGVALFLKIQILYIKKKVSSHNSQKDVNAKNQILQENVFFEYLLIMSKYNEEIEFVSTFNSKLYIAFSFFCIFPRLWVFMSLTSFSLSRWLSIIYLC